MRDAESGYQSDDSNYQTNGVHRHLGNINNAKKAQGDNKYIYAVKTNGREHEWLC